MDKLTRQERGFVLAFGPSGRKERSDSEVLFNDRLAAVVKERHPIAKQKLVTLDEIDRFDLALPTKGLQARNALEKMLANTRHCLDAKIEMNNVSLLFKVIRESNYVTILSESTVIDQRELVAVPLDVPGNDMEGCIHVLKNSYIKASSREFIRMLSSSSVMRNFGFNALHE